MDAPPHLLQTSCFGHARSELCERGDASPASPLREICRLITWYVHTCPGLRSVEPDRAPPGGKRTNCAFVLAAYSKKKTKMHAEMARKHRSVGFVKELRGFTPVHRTRFVTVILRAVGGHMSCQVGRRPRTCVRRARPDCSVMEQSPATEREKSPRLSTSVCVFPFFSEKASALRANVSNHVIDLVQRVHATGTTGQRRERTPVFFCSQSVPPEGCGRASSAPRVWGVVALSWQLLTVTAVRYRQAPPVAVLGRGPSTVPSCHRATATFLDPSPSDTGTKSLPNPQR